MPSAMTSLLSSRIVLTLAGTFEDDIELLHIVVDQSHLIVAHHELHDIRLYPSLWATHLATPASVSLGISGVA